MHLKLRWIYKAVLVHHEKVKNVKKDGDSIWISFGINKHVLLEPLELYE